MGNPFSVIPTPGSAGQPRSISDPLRAFRGTVATRRTSSGSVLVPDLTVDFLAHQIKVARVSGRFFQHVQWQIEVALMLTAVCLYIW